MRMEILYQADGTLRWLEENYLPSRASSTPEHPTKALEGVFGALPATIDGTRYHLLAILAHWQPLVPTASPCRRRALLHRLDNFDGGLLLRSRLATRHSCPPARHGGILTGTRDLDEGSSEIELFAILKSPGVALIPNRGDHFLDHFRR